MEIYDFSKDPVAIATLVLAFFTAILALGTFLIIRQNSKFREKDRKERLLYEIIEWATEITNPRSGILLKDILIFEDKSKSALNMTIKIAKMISDLQGLVGQNTYIILIASSFNSELKSAIENLLNELHKYIDFLDYLFTKLTKEFSEKKYIEFEESDVKKGDSLETSINKLAVELIIKTVKIKTKDNR
jgi:hypothetical protein